jgi:hypothetical protein
MSQADDGSVPGRIRWSGGDGGPPQRARPSQSRATTQRPQIVNKGMCLLSVPKSDFVTDPGSLVYVAFPPLTNTLRAKEST